LALRDDLARQGAWLQQNDRAAVAPALVNAAHVARSGPQRAPNAPARQGSPGPAARQRRDAVLADWLPATRYPLPASGFPLPASGCLDS
jgi:hypothetical protein